MAARPNSHRLLDPQDDVPQDPPPLSNEGSHLPNMGHISLCTWVPVAGDRTEKAKRGQRCACHGSLPYRPEEPLFRSSGCSGRTGQSAGWATGGLGPWELSPLTDGWGQLPVAGHPSHEPHGHPFGLPRWPPAQCLALNVRKAFCSRSRGRGQRRGAPFQEGTACWGSLPPTPCISLITCGQEGRPGGPLGL